MQEADLSVLVAERTTKYIYVLLDNETVIYVGCTGSLFQRLASHRFGNTQNEPKSFTRALYIEVPIADAPAYEGALVRRFNPCLVDKVCSDETRDREVLELLSLEPHQENRDAFVARVKQSYADMVSRRRLREFSRCRRKFRRDQSFARLLWKATVRFLEKAHVQTKEAA